MVSRLESLFRSTFLPATPTDSWMGIRRDEQRGEDKDKNDAPAKDGEFDHDDTTSLSVRALRHFLESLLSPESIEPDHTTAQASQDENPTTRHALHAYQNTAGLSPQPATTTSPTSVSEQLNQEEVEKIKAVLKDLDRLDAAGIESITLSPNSDTRFLDSIIRAVRLAAE